MTSPGPVLADADRIGPLPGDLSIDAVLSEFDAVASPAHVLTTAAIDRIRAAVPAELPGEGVSLQQVVDELRQSAGRYRRQNDHPGFYGWVASPGLPTDRLGHALVASLNQNVTGFHSAPGAAVIEQTLLGWFAQLAGLPATSSGLIVSGGSIANLSALGAAMHHALGPGLAQHGLAGGPQPVLFAAENAHFSIERAARMLGIGRDGVERIPVTGDFRMSVDVLAQRLQAVGEDPRRRRVCVVGTAGTTATGSVDPLEEIGMLCGEHGVWFHVDAAYGGAALLSDELRPRLSGIELADSVAIDLHKWSYLAFDGSLLLYRDPAQARSLYRVDSDYTYSADAIVGTEPIFYNLAPEVSRRARALPAYLAVRHYGINRLGRNIAHNAACAAWLGQLVENSPDLELVNHPDLSICCFRYAPSRLQGQDSWVDKVNEAILVSLNECGAYLLSPTRVDGRPVLRVCICSHTTQPQHLLGLLEQVADAGEGLL